MDGATVSSVCWRQSFRDRMPAWEPAPDWGLAALRGPRLSCLGERERGAAIARSAGGSICCSLWSVSNSPLTHNPFATISNKVWEVYFSKELCLFVIIVLTMFPHVYVYSCIWLWLYYTILNLENPICLTILLRARWRSDGLMYVFPQGIANEGKQKQP